MLPFIFDTFPPTHLPNYKDLRPKMDGDFDFRGHKKILMKMVTYYHPDRIQKEVHGMKYLVMCEEINKILSSRYNCMKGVD